MAVAGVVMVEEVEADVGAAAVVEEETTDICVEVVKGRKRRDTRFGVIVDVAVAVVAVVAAVAAVVVAGGVEDDDIII